MQAGKLRHPVDLFSPLDTQNPSTGALTRTWVPEGTEWADVRFQNGSEAIAASALLSVAKCSIRIRYRDDVVASWRVVHDGKTFDIKAVLPDRTGRQFLDLACEV